HGDQLDAVDLGQRVEVAIGEPHVRQGIAQAVGGPRPDPPAADQAGGQRARRRHAAAPHRIAHVNVSARESASAAYTEPSSSHRWSLLISWRAGSAPSAIRSTRYRRLARLRSVARSGAWVRAGVQPDDWMR